jgi:MFS family permease
MIELLEQQKKLTTNQWKLICTANLADLLDFFDFFLIGYVTAALTKQWSLTYLEGAGILLACGLGAVPGAFFSGWLGDKIGRRTVFIMSAVTISLTTGLMVFTPGPDGFVPGWLFLMSFRFFVGVGKLAFSRSICRWCRSSSLRTSVAGSVRSLRRCYPGAACWPVSRLGSSADRRLARLVPGRPGAAGSGVHDPMTMSNFLRLASLSIVSRPGR